MPYGKVDFEHVWRFQIGGMMSHQFPALVEAIHNRNSDGVIAACLHLGWNDAFKHVSENTAKFKKAKNQTEQVHKACELLVPYFKKYARLTKTDDRFNTICDFLKDPAFIAIFSPIKVITSAKYPLCLGHIQKMFNIAMKILLCLILSTEHAVSCGIKVELGKNGPDPVYLNPASDPASDPPSDPPSDPLLSHINFPYEFDTADCPIDHIILTAVEKSKTTPHSKIFNHRHYDKIVWSKMGDPKTGAKEDQQNYKSAQEEIGNIQRGTGKSNMCFDFENWR